MKITWNIEKKRGNYRPSLTYTIELEQFEKDLAVQTVNIKSTIPMIDGSHLNYCLPDEYERVEGWQPADFHWISVPHFTRGTLREHLRLPFREDGEYPEIEQSFARLREKFEAIVQEAYHQKPISITGEMDITSETRKAVAASLAAKKMLLFGGD